MSKAGSPIGYVLYLTIATCAGEPAGSSTGREEQPVF